jgi:hypothetical protein
MKNGQFSNLGGLIQKIFAKSGEMWYSGKNTHWRIFGWKEKS